MKVKQKFLGLCGVALIVTGVSSEAALSGLDTFESGTLDSAKWVASDLFSSGLEPVAGVLTFSSSGLSAAEGSEWILNTSGPDQSWVATVDAQIALDESLFSNNRMLVAMAIVPDLADPALDVGAPWFDVALEKNRDAHDQVGYYYAVNSVPGDDDLGFLETGPQLSGDSVVTLRVSYDATTKLLLSSYDAGAGFVEVASYNVTNWNMSVSDSFTLHLACISEEMAYAPGSASLDNFRIYSMSADDISPTISADASQVTIGINTLSGYYYELWATTNLVTTGWDGPLDSIVGSNDIQQVSVAVGGEKSRSFQVRASELSPSSVEFSALVVGTTLPGTDTAITSPTRFIWDGSDAGDWSYLKTGLNTALLVFTYDDAGNDPGVYREEVVLTFTGKGEGTNRYSEFNGNVEDPGSVSVAPFSFN